ncbi:unnamed protein product [Calypogeia fissa]
MILEALFLTALVMSSFYMCEMVNDVSPSKCGRGFEEGEEEWEEIPPEIGPEEDPSIETIFTITLSKDEEGEKVAVEDGWSGPGPLDFAEEEDGGEKESFLERKGKGPMRLHFRVAWRENPLFNEVV